MEPIGVHTSCDGCCTYCVRDDCYNSIGAQWELVHSKLIVSIGTHDGGLGGLWREVSRLG